MTNIDYVLEKAIKRDRLSFEDGLELFTSNEVEKIGKAADMVKRRLHPEPITTFVIGRNINYSNVCDTGCMFCAYHKKPGEKGGFVLSTEEILQKIEETVKVGGTEILMQGGTHPGLPFKYYTRLLKEIKEHYPYIHMHSFSPAEIEKMADKSGLSLEETIRQLKEAGLDSLPGAGAEILDDRTRLEVSTKKGSWQDWIKVMKTANKLGLATTGTMVIGLGETMEERVLHLIRLREAQDESKGFLAFIPWTFQPENTELKKDKVPPEEYLKTVAISRLMLDNISNLQSSWVTMGAEIGKLSLSYGCNDFGSTMMEENVVSAAGTAFKINTNQIISLIWEAGFTPAQRNTKYEIMRIFEKGEKTENDFIMHN